MWTDLLECTLRNIWNQESLLDAYVCYPPAGNKTL